MNRELEKLVQQYADLYPYQPAAGQQGVNSILSAPEGVPLAQSISIPVEQRPPILNPVAKDIQLLPIPAAVRTLDTDRLREQVKSRNQIVELFCGENLFRLVLVAIIVICMILYFRKK